MPGSLPIKGSKSEVINISDLSFAYKGQSNTLSIPSFIVLARNHTFLYGPSGSGKSTLLGLLTGTLSPQRGSIEILGHKITDMTSHQRDRFRGDHLGYVFQIFNLIPYLNVIENVTLPLVMSRVKRSLCPSPYETAVALLSDLKIDHLKDKKVTELSIGQQQRVAVARSLIGRPKLIVADEPTSSLDYDNREIFIDLLFKSADKTGASILFVSHDHSLQKMFDQAIALEDINVASKES